MKAAYAEPGAPAETAEELAAELRDLAGWLGLPTSRSSRGATSLRRSRLSSEQLLDPVRPVRRTRHRPDRGAQAGRGLAVRARRSSRPASTGASTSGFAERLTTAPAPAAATLAPTIGWSRSGCIGMTSTGRSCASACMVVPWPPCPTTSDMAGITSACGT